MSANSQQSIIHIVGFTLIEVLIALAILSASFTTIFQMFHQSGLSNHKVSEIYSRTMIERNLFSELNVLNPAESMSGTHVLGHITYKWNAVPLTPLMQMRADDGNSQSYIQLYRVTVTYQGKSNQQHSFSFEKLGWEIKLN